MHARGQVWVYLPASHSVARSTCHGNRLLPYLAKSQGPGLCLLAARRPLATRRLYSLALPLHAGSGCYTRSPLSASTCSPSSSSSPDQLCWPSHGEDEGGRVLAAAWNSLRSSASSAHGHVMLSCTDCPYFQQQCGPSSKRVVACRDGCNAQRAGKLHAGLRLWLMKWMTLTTMRRTWG